MIPSKLFEVELLILKLQTLQIDEHVESHISIQDSKAIVVITIIDVFARLDSSWKMESM